MSSVTDRPLIALISAVPAAIPPAVAAFAEEFPEARVWNILDDRLLEEADARGGVTPQLVNRMERLIRHAEAEGADGILVTCSMYGPVAHALAPHLNIPLYGSDDAAFEAAVHGGFGSLLLIAPSAGPLADSVKRLAALAESEAVELTVAGAVADKAPAAARAGDVAALAAALHDAYVAADVAVDAILLGQFSTSPAAQELSRLTGLPVLAPPQRAAAVLKTSVAAGGVAL